MALENYLTYDVYDPDDRVTVSPSALAVAGSAASQYSVHRVCPPGTYSGDFEYHVSVKITDNRPVGQGYAAFWGLSNNTDDGPHGLVQMQRDGATYLYATCVVGGAVAPRIILREVVGGVVHQAIAAEISYGTTYYCEIKYEQSLSTYGTLTLNIYRDAARNVLHDSVFVELHAAHSFRTQYATASHYDGNQIGEYLQDIEVWPQTPQGRGAIVTGAAQVSGTGYSSPGGYEGVDYTAFDENDIASHLVVTPHTVDVSGNNQWPFSLQYIYPEGMFGKNFTHAVSVRLNSASGSLHIPVWGVSNWTTSGIHALRGLRDAGETFLCAYMRRSGNKAQLWLYEFHEGNATGQASHMNLNLDQWYHLEFERKVDDVLGVSTLRCRIYTDSMRTQELSGVAFDLAQPDETYRTLYGAAAWDIADGAPAEVYSLNLKNLSLKIPVVIGIGHIVTGAAQVSGVGVSSEAPPAIAPSEYAGLFGQRLFGQFWKLIGLVTEPPAPTMPIEVASIVERRYRLEVHETWETKAGSTYIFGSIEIPRFIDGRVTQRLNEAATLSLTVPTSEPCARYLRRPYLIRLYSPQGTLIETFVIWGVTESDDTVSLTALGLESNLARGVLTEGYHVAESEGLPVRYHIENLLAQQELRPIIGFGAVDVDIRTQVRGLHVDKGASILHALYQLHETVGGHIWVTPTGLLNWQAERGRDVGQDFVIGHNLANLKVSYDYSELVTKLFYYGQAEGHAQNLSLIDAGEADEFLLAEKSVRDEHGIITRVVVDTEVTDAAVLLSRAQRYLDAHKQPSAIYEADVLDLSHDPAYGFSDAKGVSLGDLVSLREEVKLEGEQPARLPGRHVQQHIVAIDRDLRHPASTRVTFGKMRDNLLDLFADLQSQLNAPPDVGVPYAQMNGTLDGLVGLRHGSIMFDKSDSMFKGLLLDPPDGRWPGADATLISLGSIEEGDIEEIIQQFIELNIGNYVDVPEPGENIQSVGTENSPGTGTAYARANHVHKMPVIGAVWLPFDDPYANWED
jgi:phage minor structural protein